MLILDACKVYKLTLILVDWKRTQIMQVLSKFFLNQNKLIDPKLFLWNRVHGIFYSLLYTLISFKKSKSVVM